MPEQVPAGDPERPAPGRGPRGSRLLGLYLGLALLTLFMTLPFLWLLATSLKSGDVYAVGAGGWLSAPTLRYYGLILERLPELWTFFGNTALICLAGVALEVALASMAAYPLARMEFRGKGWIFAALLATLMIPNQAHMIVNFITIRQLGLFDTLTAVVLPGAVSVFGIFLMRQAMLVIPRELEDAARVDGCGEWGLFRHVALPLVRPALGTLALFSFVSQWNSLMWPLVVLKSTERFPLSVGLAYMAESFDSEFRLVAAGSILGMLPALLLFVALQRQFIRGITAGALK